VILKWYQGGHKPENRPEWGLDSIPSGGMIMVGDKVSLMTGPRPENERLLIPEDEWLHFLENQPEQTIPRETAQCQDQILIMLRTLQKWCCLGHWRRKLIPALNMTQRICKPLVSRSLTNI
jgi:hypothetical protein